MKLIEIKWIEVSNSQKKQTPITATEKKQLWKYEIKNDLKKKIIIVQQSSPFLIPQKKLNNNEKKMNSNQVWSHILKKNKFMYLKSTYSFFKYNSPKHCPISRKKCLFCIQNKKVVKQLLAKMILKKNHFGFPPISILTYPSPFALQCRCAHFCLIFFPANFSKDWYFTQFCL